MATITGYVLEPPTGPYPPSSTIKITPEISNPQSTHTFTGTLDGVPVVAEVTVGETIAYGNPGEAAIPGLFIPAVDSGTVLSNGDGSYNWTLPAS